MKRVLVIRRIVCAVLLWPLLAAVASARAPLLETLDGKGVDLAQLPPHAVVLIWSPDCTFCFQEMADISRANDPAINAALVVVGLLPRKEIQQWRDRLPSQTALLLASRAAPPDVTTALGNPQGVMPYMALLDGHGHLCVSLFGRITVEQLHKSLDTCASQ